MSTQTLELVVDSFAGGGGASKGIEEALGYSPHIAINHDEAAIVMHARNHPKTRHYTADVFTVNPRQVTKGHKVGLLWASPDCRHFSRAKGDVPVSRKIRGLAWVVVKWAAEVRPRVIILENVCEFADWAPLVNRWECRSCDWKGTEGQTMLVRNRNRCPRCQSLKVRETEKKIPCPQRRGLSFRIWVGRLRGLGYQVEWRALNAADFGAPTNRKRLFLVARCDGQPIVWPEPTHAPPEKCGDENDMPLFAGSLPKLKPYRTAADCIDWSLPCPSIFDRPKPLAEKTLRRIALGLKRYVLENPKPFIVGVGGRAGQSPPTSTTSPLGTITSKADRALINPVLVGVGGPGYSGKPKSVTTPMHTLIKENHTGLSAPLMVPLTHAGERRAHDPSEPLPNGGNHAAIAAMLKHYGGVVGQSVDAPTGTIRAKDHSLMTANIVKFRGDSIGHGVDAPLPTITSGANAARPAGAAHALGVSAVYLARWNHGEKQWNAVCEPLGTVTSQGNKFGLVYAFLLKYFGTAIGADFNEPMPTAKSKLHFGVVMVEVVPGKFEPAVSVNVPGLGPCIIVDIGLRMLTPRELARAQGFPDSYILTGSKSQQVARIGNSVCPPVARAMVAANYKPCDVSHGTCCV